MSQSFFTIPIRVKVSTAARIMSEKQVSWLIVVDPDNKNKLVGFRWYRTENHVQAVEMVNATSAGSDTAPTIESEQAIDEKFDGIRYVFFYYSSVFLLLTINQFCIHVFSLSSLLHHHLPVQSFHKIVL